VVTGRMLVGTERKQTGKRGKNSLEKKGMWGGNEKRHNRIHKVKLLTGKSPTTAGKEKGGSFYWSAQQKTGNKILRVSGSRREREKGITTWKNDRREKKGGHRKGNGRSFKSRNLVDGPT